MAAHKKTVHRHVSHVVHTHSKVRESIFAHRPYFTIVVLAALVCALAVVVELITQATEVARIASYLR